MSEKLIEATNESVNEDPTTVSAVGLPIDPQDPVSRAHRGDGWWAKLWPPVLMFAAFLAVWYLYSWLRFGNNTARRINTLPFPNEVLTQGFFPLWGPAEGPGLRPILGYMVPTVKVTLAGLAVSIVLGVFVAIVMNLSKGAERAFFPYAVVIQTIPVLAILPLLTSLFGQGFGVRLVVVVIIAIFPIITNAFFGLQSIDRLHHDLFTLNHASRWTRLRKLELPGALPAIMTGIRIAAGAAVIGSVVADTFFNQGEKGIGYYISNAQKRASDRPEMFAATIVASLFGVVMFLIVGYVTTRAIRNWHDSARNER